MIKRKNKRAVAPLFILALILIGGAVLISSGMIDIGTIVGAGTGEYIERPVFKYVKCEQVSDIKNSEPNSEPYSLINQVSDGWLTMRPSVTDAYSVDIKIPAKTKSGINYRRIVYSVCNSKVNDASNCLSSKYNVPIQVNTNQEIRQTISDIKYTQYVRVIIEEYGLFTGFKWKQATVDGSTYQLNYRPYGLREYNFLAGPSGSIVPNDCKVSSSEESYKDRLLSSDISKVNQAESQTIANDQETQLDPNEVRWYVSGYVTSAAPSFKLIYSGQEAWCKKDGTSASIYKINKVQLGSGTYKIASVDYSDRLGTEKTCCPGDKEPGRACNDKFQWVSMTPVDNKGTTNVACSAFNPCDGASWTPLTTKVVARYSCVGGQCVQSTKNVDCSSDTDCISTNQICDRNSFSCVDANVNIKGEKLEIIPDNSADCEKKGGTWITTKETKKEGVLCFYGIGLCSETVVAKDYCDLGGKFDWNKLIFWIIIVIVVILLIRFFPVIRAIFKSIPFIGRYIP